MPTIEAIKNWIKQLWPKKTPPQRVFISPSPWSEAPLKVVLPPAATPLKAVLTPVETPLKPSVVAVECPCCKPAKEGRLYVDPAAARKALAERLKLRNR